MIDNIVAFSDIKFQLKIENFPCPGVDIINPGGRYAACSYFRNYCNGFSR